MTHSGSENTAAQHEGAEPATGGAPQPMTVGELRAWLADWVASATGVARAEVDENRPMEEFGLSSRDAVALSGEIEDLTGTLLDATIVYQHPTIASLAQRIVDGPSADEAAPLDDAFYLRGADDQSRAHDIAVVGVATRFPGAGSTPDDMWRMLADGRDGITELPEGRWDEYRADPAVAAAIDEATTLGGYLDDVKGFDAEFFSMSPREALHVDPQQRLAMELTWEALEHAHLPADELRGERVGVFVGTSANDYALLEAADPAVSHPYGITGNSTAIIANRISYFFDFRGPSVALDTACSSSLVAVHQAVRALRAGEADLAVAGGTNMLIAPPASLGFSELGVMAPDGRIKAFSDDADGMIRSEGGGMLVLKRLDDAERDGDTILAVVAGSAVGQDGRSNGLTAPNPEAQVDVLQQAYRDAGIPPAQVDYIEAHGTGTVLGDPIEAGALGRVVGAGRAADAPALLGSAKTNFGHLEAAAGAAGLIKVVLGIAHDAIPPSLNFRGPNPHIDFDAAHLRMVTETTPWPRYSGAAVAGVSGFGFGGTNAHVVLREHVPAAGEGEAPADAAVEAPADSAVAEPAPFGETVLLVVSGPMPSRRRRAAAELANWLETAEGSRTPLADVGRTLARRTHGRSRAAVLATTRAEAIAGLRAVAAGTPAPNVLSADSPAAEGPVWVYSGYGSQHRKMAKQLYQANPVFRAAIDEIDEYIDAESGFRVGEMIMDDAQDYGIETSQVGIYAIQVALSMLLRHHGAEPAAVLGHSMGEASSAYVSGGLSLEDATRVICVRSRLMDEGEKTVTGDDIRKMAIVEYSAAEIHDALGEFPDLEVCVYAAPNQTVIGGPEPQVQAMVARCEELGKFSHVLKTNAASHTSQVDPILGELVAELAGLETFPLRTALFSSVHEGQRFPAGTTGLHDEAHWSKNMRHSVWFDQSVKSALDAGHTTFVEFAPNPVTLMSIAMTCFAAGVNEPELIQTLKRKEDEPAGVLRALATLYVHGHKVDVRSLFAPGPYAELPRTPWLRKPLWVDVRVGGAGAGRVPGSHVALPDGRHAWEIPADAVSDVNALVLAAAGQLLADPAVGAVAHHRELDGAGTVTTTLTPHLGGASVQVHARGGDGSFALVADAVVTSSAPLPERAVVAPRPAAADTDEDADEFADAATAPERWDPDGPVSLEDRLAQIVAESMGFAAEDLPREIPLIELGLDSLMAVRIKNRVEYEFDIPQLQLQAVRDANLQEVAGFLRYAVENREEVAALAEEQQREAEASGADGADAGAVSGADAAAAATEPTPAAATEPTPAAATEPTPAATPAAEKAQDVPPRDAAERLTFGTWALVVGHSARGIFTPLPTLDDAQAEALAARLTERAGGEVTAEQVRGAGTIEELSDVVREHLEGGDVGLVRTLRARPEGSEATPVFVFHPAGGSTVVYEPLLRRLPEGTPMYGFERVEGEIAERAEQYLAPLRELQPHGPYVLAGWSLGGVLAYAVAKLLRDAGEEVALVGLIDVVMPGEPIPDTVEERRARWNRYIAFAEKTYGVEVPLPVDQLAETDDEGAVQILLDMLSGVELPIPGGVIEHQRTSFLENRALARAAASLTPYDGPAVLYMADTYHEGAIELEPAYATRAADGGWGGVLTDLEIVQVGGDHLAIVDEPYIAKVGAHMSRRLRDIDSRRGGAGRPEGVDQ